MSINVYKYIHFVGNRSLLEQAIIDEIQLAPTSVSIGENYVILLFDVELDAQQKSGLDAAVLGSDHVPEVGQTDQVLRDARISFSIPRTVDVQTYRYLQEFTYAGTFEDDLWKRADVNAYVSSESTPEASDMEYDIRLVDITNNVVLGEASFSNTVRSNCPVDIDTELLPVRNATIEIQLRKGALGDSVKTSSVDIVFTE
nr:hypothetical protein TetV2_00277 [Oceanusvirus sp.]